MQFAQVPTLPQEDVSFPAAQYVPVQQYPDWQPSMQGPSLHCPLPLQVTVIVPQAQFTW